MDPMIPNLLFLAAICWFAWKGFRQGLAKALAGVIALASAYASAIALTPRAANWVAANTPLDGLIAYAAGGMAVFIGTLVSVSLVCSLLIHLLDLEHDDEGEIRYPVLGAIFNGGVGAVIGLVVVWLMALLQISIAPGNEPQEPQGVVKVADRIVGYATTTILDGKKDDDPVTQKDAEGEPASLTTSLTETVTKSPLQGIGEVNAILKNQELKSLMQDPETRALLSEGRVDELMQNDTMNRLMEDPSMKNLLQKSGVDTSDPDTAKRQMAENMSNTWRKMESVSQSEEFRQIIADPEFRTALESGNPIKLLNHPAMKRMTELITTAKAREVSPVEDEQITIIGNPDPFAQPVDGEYRQPAQKIRGWQDENGHWHFTNQQGE